jgi:hypothetical protein
MKTQSSLLGSISYVPRVISDRAPVCAGASPSAGLLSDAVESHFWIRSGSHLNVVAHPVPSLLTVPKLKVSSSLRS